MEGTPAYGDCKLAVISTLGFVSYHIGDNVTATTDRVPKPVNGAAPATSYSPTLTSLPAKIVRIPLKDVRGPSSSSRERDLRPWSAHLQIVELKA